MADTNGKKPIYDRIILKVFGEAFRKKDENRSYGSYPIKRLADEIAFIHNQGIKIGIVMGGGNIARGRELPVITEHPKGRSAAHEMGILATVSNAICLQARLEILGCEVRMQSTIVLPFLPYPHQRQKANAHLKNGHIVIFAGGTGSTYHTTDYAAAVRAMEIEADAILKGTKINGIFKKFPVTDAKEKPLSTIKYEEALKMDLDQIWDSTALPLLIREKINIPIHFYNHFENPSDSPENRNLWKILCGEKIGTVITP